MGSQEKISISCNGQVKHFCLQEGISVQLFEGLLKEVFAIDTIILGLQSIRTGVIYDIGEFCNSYLPLIRNDTFSLITSSQGSHSLQQNQRTNAFQRSHSIPAHSHRGYSKNSATPRSQQRNKSIELSHPHRNSLRYSSKSASKYSSEEKCQYYVEDYEVFTATTSKDLADSFFCFLFFDETKVMRLYGQTICKSYQVHFPQVEFYYSLYPSKRSRGPFSPSDDSYLLSFFHGNSMIFEREVAVSLEISEEMVKALNQYLARNDLSHSKENRRILGEENAYTENSFSVINQLGSETYFPKQNGSFSEWQEQDHVFELVECLSQQRVRTQFSDEEFRELLKLVRKNNKKINMIYQQFKVYNDYDELVMALRSLMNLPLVDFFTESIKNKKGDLTRIKNLKRFIKLENSKSSETNLTNSEIGYLIYSLKQNDKELDELLHSLNDFTSSKTIFAVLKAYSSSKMNALLAKQYSAKELAYINKEEQKNNTPIHAAFLNWMTFGNLSDLQSILDSNIPPLSSSQSRQRTLQTKNKQPSEKIFVEEQDLESFSEKFEGSSALSSLLNYATIGKEPSEIYVPSPPQVQIFKYSRVAESSNRTRKPTFSLRTYAKNDNQLVLTPNLSDSLEIEKRSCLEQYFTQQCNMKDEKYYHIYSQLISQKYIAGAMMKSIEEAYEYNYPPLYEILDKFCQTLDIQLELKIVLQKFNQLKQKIQHILSFKSPIAEEKLLKYKGFAINLAHQHYQEMTLSERAYQVLNALFLRHDWSIIASYELYSQDLDVSEFLHTIKLAEQLAFLKQSIDHSEIEHLDQDGELSYVILFLLKSTTLSEAILTTVEQAIKFGDKEILQVFNSFKDKKDPNSETLLRQISLFAEHRAHDVAQIEQHFPNKHNSNEEQRQIEYQLDLIFSLQALFKNIKYMNLIENLIHEKNPIIRGAFEVHDLSKDKKDFVETISAIYEWVYPVAFKNLIRTETASNQIENNQQIQNALCNMIDENNQLVMAIWEVYLQNNDIDDFRDSLSIFIDTFNLMN